MPLQVQSLNIKIHVGSPQEATRPTQQGQEDKKRKQEKIIEIAEKVIKLQKER